MSDERKEEKLYNEKGQWRGAGRAITGKWEAAKWYAMQKHNIQLAPNTQAMVEKLLAACTETEGKL